MLTLLGFGAEQKDAEATSACVCASGGGSAPQAQMLEVSLGTAVL